ncbi:MAG: hypothetical protein ACTSP9_01190 [Promethearchaeota archaeon]
MSSRSKAGTIIVMLIVAITIGFGAYYIINLQTQINSLKDDSGVVNTWHNILLNTIDVNSTFEPIGQLNTTIEVNAGEWVHVSFAGNAKLDPTDTLRHSLVFYFAIDDELKAPGFVYEENLDDATEDDVEWVPISFYAIFEDLVPGTYIISIHVTVSYNYCPAQIGGLNSFFGSSLLTQTLIP